MDRIYKEFHQKPPKKLRGQTWHDYMNTVFNAQNSLQTVKEKVLGKIKVTGIITVG